MPLRPQGHQALLEIIAMHGIYNGRSEDTMSIPIQPPYVLGKPPKAQAEVVPPYVRECKEWPLGGQGKEARRREKKRELKIDGGYERSV
jgi:hypothetical protein